MQVRIRQAGQHGYREHHRLGRGLAGGLDGGPQHFAAAGGMDGEHAYAEFGSRADRPRDSVRDVVIFQVEKHLAAGGDQVADDLRSLGRKELFADLVGGCSFADRLDDLAGLGGARDIERHYEPVFVVHRLQVYRIKTRLLRAFVLGYEWGFDDLQANGIHAVVAHAENFCRAIGQVNDPVLPYRPAIVDADDDRPVILQICNLDPGTQRQGAMRRCELVHVVRFAAGRLLMLKDATVPGSLPDLKLPGLNGLHFFLNLSWGPLLLRIRCAITGCRAQCGGKNYGHRDLAEYS